MAYFVRKTYPKYCRNEYLGRIGKTYRKIAITGKKFRKLIVNVWKYLGIGAPFHVSVSWIYL